MLYGYRPIRLWYSDTLWPGSREQKWDWLEDRPEGDLADRPAPVYWWFWMSGQLDRLNFSFASLMMDAPKPVASGASLAGPVHIECIEKEVRLEHHWRDASLQWCTQKSTVVSQSVYDSMMYHCLCLAFLLLRSGQSSKTLDKSLKYIQEKRPVWA